MATIDTRRDKAGNITGYRFRACIARDEQGKQVWRTVTVKKPIGLTPAREKKEVERQADEWERAQVAQYSKTHSKEDIERITFECFVRDHWLKDHVMDGEHSPSSVSFFRYTAENLIEYFGQKRLKQIDVEAVKRYLRYLNVEATTKKGEPLSATTKQHHFGTLRNILGYARRLRYIREDPTTDLTQKEKPHRDKKKVDFLDTEQAVKFMSCLETEPLYWRCLMNILITTGLRRGEAVALRWGDLNTKELEIAVERNVTLDKESESGLHIGKTKTGESRVVPVSARLCSLLIQFKKEQERRYKAVLLPTSFIFCNEADPYKPLRPDSVTKHVRKFEEKNGLPSMSPHDLRHTAA